MLGTSTRKRNMPPQQIYERMKQANKTDSSKISSRASCHDNIYYENPLRRVVKNLDDSFFQCWVFCPGNRRGEQEFSFFVSGVGGHDVVRKDTTLKPHMIMFPLSTVKGQHFPIRLGNTNTQTRLILTFLCLNRILVPDQEPTYALLGGTSPTLHTRLICVRKLANFHMRQWQG
jgi:hypothetical protein